MEFVTQGNCKLCKGVLSQFSRTNCINIVCGQESDGDGGAREKKERKTEAEVVG